jgi:anoctamin-10
MLPHVDLVIVFRGSSKAVFKQQVLDEARKAEGQYSRLIKTLKAAGLRAVGRRGEKQGHLLVFVSCPQSRLSNIVQREG